MMWLALLLACRPDPGMPDYPEVDGFVDTANPELLGFTPYDPTVRRLSFGVYYEGEATEVVPVDGVTQHFYIYSNTFAQAPSDDRVEGAQSDQVVVGNVGWWGGGIHWDNGGDLRSYGALHMGLKGSDPSFENFEVGMVTGDEVETRLRVADYGFVADGEWHSVTLPLAQLEALGADLGAVGVPLLMIGTGENPGAELRIDDVYITAEVP